MKIKIFISFLFVAVFTAVALGQSSTPAGTVRSVLVYEKSTNDTGFSKRRLKVYKKWVTPELYKLLEADLVREKRYIQEHPTNKPYWGDGFFFGTWWDNCKANGRDYTSQFSVRKAIISGDSAVVPAHFFYNKACHIDALNVNRFKLVRRPSGWLINDIDYGSNSTLRKDLRKAPR